MHPAMAVWLWSMVMSRIWQATFLAEEYRRGDDFLPGKATPMLIGAHAYLITDLPVATSRAAQIDLDRMIEWNRARTCEQVLPCLHQPHVQFVLSDPQRRGDPPSVSDLRQSSEPARSAARNLSRLDRSRHKEGRGRRARAPTVSWGFVLLQPGKAPRRVINVGQLASMLKCHPEIAHIDKGTAAGANHEMIEIALRRPARRLTDDIAGLDDWSRRPLRHHARLSRQI